MLFYSDSYNMELLIKHVIGLWRLITNMAPIPAYFNYLVIVGLGIYCMFSREQ